MIELDRAVSYFKERECQLILLLLPLEMLLLGLAKNL